MALTRYDQRKNYEEDEANAIGTEVVRAELLPGAQAAWRNRIPAAAWTLMGVLALIANVLVGLGVSRSRGEPILLLVLPVVVSVAFLLIADIDSPRGAHPRGAAESPRPGAILPEGVSGALGPVPARRLHRPRSARRNLISSTVIATIASAATAMRPSRAIG